MSASVMDEITAMIRAQAEAEAARREKACEAAWVLTDAVHRWRIHQCSFSDGSWSIACRLAP